MKTSRLSYGFTVSFLCFLLILRWWEASLVTIAILCGIALLVAVLFKKRTMLPIVTAVLLGLLLAFGSVSHMRSERAAHDLAPFASPTTMTAHGWITDALDARPTQTKFTVTIDEITRGKKAVKAEGTLLATDYGSWPPLHYGDEVTVTGVLQVPGIIDTFDYTQYLAVHGISAVVPRAKVRRTLTNAVQPSFARTYAMFGLLYDWREAVENRIGMVFPEPHGSLLAGLLTGTRRGLPKNLSDDFRTAGLTHIVAVSGYNVTVILSIFGSFLFWLPLKKRFLPLALGALGFAVFTGGSPPVVRAAIMGVLGLLALQTERVATPRLIVLWTAVIMLIPNPMMLWHDASFQLSFLAVIGLMELSPYLKKIFVHVPETLGIRDSLTATVAAQIATLPISMIIFRQLSLVAPVTNILVAPLIPLAMLTGSLATLLSVVWMPLGLLVGYLGWLLLQMILWIATVGAHVPLAALHF